MRMRLSLAAVCVALVAPAEVSAQTGDVVAAEGAEGTLVTVKQPSAPATSVGQTESVVSAGTSADPAASTGAAIADGNAQTGQVTTDVSTPTDDAPETSVTTDTAKVQVEEPTTSTTTSTLSTAETAVNVAIDEGKIDAQQVRVKVRGAKSRSRAAREKRRMESSAMTEAISDGPGRPGVDIDQVVTVDRVRAEAHSRAGAKVESTRALRIEGLRVRTKSGSPLIHVRWARMRADGSVATRITLGKGPSAMTRTLTLDRSRSGADLLAARTYEGTSLADMFAELVRNGDLARLRERVEVVRIGGSFLRNDPDRRETRAGVTAISVKLARGRSHSDGTAAQFGAITTIVGDVSSAAVQAATPLVTLADVTEFADEVSEAPRTLVEGVSEIPGVVASLPGILSGESFSIRPRLEAIRPAALEVSVEISCAADLSGELVLVSADGEQVALAKGQLRCMDGQQTVVDLSVLRESFFDDLDVPTGVVVLPQLDLEDSDAVLSAEPVTLVAPENP